MDGTALVLCEGGFGTPIGKTAHGLVRHTKRYRVLGVIDSKHRGGDAGEILDGRRNGIPIFGRLEEALATLQPPPDYLVIGLAPDGGRLPPEYRAVVKQALLAGLHVDSGLHDFLSDDRELVEAASASGARIRDVRKTPPRSELHGFSGAIDKVAAVRVAVLGTDSAVGKRTTAVLLDAAFNQRGVPSLLIGTGQTSWMQGTEYGLILDSLINDFVAGEIEHAIVQADRERHPKILFLEGQGSLTNPAYPGGFELLAAGRPAAIVLQHAPRRMEYDGFPGYLLRPIEDQIHILEFLSEKRVVGITLNHENMTPAEVEDSVQDLEHSLRLPTCDPLWHGVDKIVAELQRRFPGLRG